MSEPRDTKAIVVPGLGDVTTFTFEEGSLCAKLRSTIKTWNFAVYSEAVALGATYSRTDQALDAAFIRTAGPAMPMSASRILRASSHPAIAAELLRRSSSARAALQSHGAFLSAPLDAVANLMYQGQNLPLHRDVPSYATCGAEPLAIWLRGVMSASGLFEPFRVQVATVVVLLEGPAGASLTVEGAGSFLTSCGQGVVFDAERLWHAVSEVSATRRRVARSEHLEGHCGSSSDWKIEGTRRTIAEQVRVSLTWRFARKSPAVLISNAACEPLTKEQVLSRLCEAAQIPGIRGDGIEERRMYRATARQLIRYYLGPDNRGGVNSPSKGPVNLGSRGPGNPSVNRQDRHGDRSV
jgi:hypothetical protein